MATAHFSSDTLKFLTELEAHNDRAWFQENKARFEKSVRDPFVAFLGDLAPRVAKISKHFVFDPRPVGGSMMRIHRDTRFSKDKSPYKTSMGALVRHAKSTDATPMGLYLRLQPQNCAVGAGVWQPGPDALAAIRGAIAKKPAEWKKVTATLRVGARCGLMGESLKRPPPGFDADHPCIEDIKRKDFAGSLEIADARVTKPGFIDDVMTGYAQLTPYLKFLTKAVGLPF